MAILLSVPHCMHNCKPPVHVYDLIGARACKELNDGSYPNTKHTHLCSWLEILSLGNWLGLPGTNSTNITNIHIFLSLVSLKNKSTNYKY